MVVGLTKPEETAVGAAVLGLSECRRLLVGCAAADGRISPSGDSNMVEGLGGIGVRVVGRGCEGR